MNKKESNEIETSSKQSADNNEVSGASNAKVTHMYNMKDMTSGPSDATSEEKRKTEERSAASKGNNKR